MTGREGALTALGFGENLTALLTPPPPLPPAEHDEHDMATTELPSLSDFRFIVTCSTSALPTYLGPTQCGNRVF